MMRNTKDIPLFPKRPLFPSRFLTCGIRGSRIVGSRVRVGVEPAWRYVATTPVSVSASGRELGEQSVNPEWHRH
jgi:hypothetical protein